MTIWTGEIQEIEKLYSSFKGQIPDLDKEIEPLLKTDDAIVIMVYSRRCLEVLVTDLCETELKRPRKTQPLKGIIDLLNSENKVPEHIVSSMQSLNSLSAFGAHPKDFDPKQVRTILINLETVLEWYLKYKDIGLGHNKEPLKSKQDEVSKHKIKSNALKKTKIIIGAFTSVALLVFIGSLIYPKLFKNNELENLASLDRKISVAVMPFQNMTNDSTLKWFQYGIQLDLISSLAETEELVIRSKESIDRLLQSKNINEFASISPIIGSEISQKLEADMFICGSFQKTGKTIRLNAQLIDTKTQDVIKPFELSGPNEEEQMTILSDSLRRKIRDYLIISRLIKKDKALQHQFTPPRSAEVMKLFLNGQKAMASGDVSGGIKLALKALELDSTFYAAAYMVEHAYQGSGKTDLGCQWLIRNYEMRHLFSFSDQLIASWAYSYSFGSRNDQIMYLEQLIADDDQEPFNHYLLGLTYQLMDQYDKAIPEYLKSIDIIHKWGKEFMREAQWESLGYCYHKTGNYKKEHELYNEFEKYNLENPWFFRRKAILAFSENDTIAANSFVDKFITILKGNASSETFIADFLGDYYAQIANFDKAEDLYRKTIELEPDNTWRLTYLARFFIDNNRKLNEVGGLMDKAMKISANKVDYYRSMNTKGWALYKQGKNKEALIILEKCWNETPYKLYDIKSHYEEVKKAVEAQK
ncbi:MAG: hypothetical protein U0W24_02255 [Bacteroidales bacterium]